MLFVVVCPDSVSELPSKTKKKGVDRIVSQNNTLSTI